MFLEISVLENFANSTGKHQHRCFPIKFAKILAAPGKPCYGKFQRFPGYYHNGFLVNINRYSDLFFPFWKMLFPYQLYELTARKNISTFSGKHQWNNSFLVKLQGWEEKNSVTGDTQRISSNISEQLYCRTAVNMLFKLAPAHGISQLFCCNAQTW